MNVSLAPMTGELCREYYRGFENDPDIFMDTSLFKQFVYSDEKADAYFNKQLDKHRIFLAVMCDGKPVGELIFKDIDDEKRECVLSIHLQNDSVKGRGIGTEAERLALIYAFSELKMSAVNADAVIKNKRSQHVLEKVGFRFIREEGIFRYYRCERSSVTKEAFLAENRLKFEKAVFADIDAVCALYRSAIGTEGCIWGDGYPSRETAENDISYGGLHVLCLDDRIIGAVSVVPENELDGIECFTVKIGAKEFARITVSDELRGKGYAGYMLRKLTENAVREGATAWHILAAKSNSPALALYRSFGFTFLGEYEAYGNIYLIGEMVL